MALDELKKMAKALKGQIATSKTTNPLNPHGIREEKLKTLLAEREQWKQKAAFEQRKLNETLEAIELQKKIMQGSSSNLALGTGGKSAMTT